MANTYLQRAISNGNRRTWTWSAWVKRSKLDSAQVLADNYTDGSNYAQFYFSSGNTLNFYAPPAGSWSWHPLYRDTNAWYHIVLRCDTTQGSNGDRLRLYVNGELVSANAVAGINQNQELNFNASSQIRFGAQQVGSSNYFDGLISHAHFTDGQSYAPTVFGETDSTTGEWKIKTSPSISTSDYGTNGWFILKDGNSVTDQSGNSNNFTIVAGNLTKTEDNPSNVFCTWNPLSQTNSGMNFNRGNTALYSSAAWLGQIGTLAMESGKYYWEIKYAAGNYGIGVAAWNTASTDTNKLSVGNYGYAGRYTGGYELFQNSGQPYKLNASNNNGNYGTQASANNIIMVAFDADNYKLYTGLNGNWNNSSNPATGANPMYTVASGYAYTPTHSIENGSGECNFGNGYFGLSAVSSAGTNASGNGIFEYNVPAGFTALSTTGLNL